MEVQEMKTTGSFLRSWRERRFDTQYKAAVALGVREVRVNEWENDKAVPTGKIVLRMIQVYGVPDLELLDLTDGYGPLAMLRYSQGLPPALAPAGVAM